MNEIHYEGEIIMGELRTVAREVLELRILADKFSEGWHDGIKIDASDVMLLISVANMLEQQPVAYRHFHEDGWEYYDAPTGEDCEGCQPLYAHS
jgi:hypothetical protein